MTDKTSYLIYRHGSNAANQSMTLKMAVGIVVADTYEEARKEALTQINCYNNQYLEVVEESESDEADWKDVLEQDATLIANEGESIIFTASNCGL
jgi:hypothetical protein